jgi:hypothetical protein
MGLQLTLFPTTVFKSRVGERDDGRKDRYFHVAAHLPQPEQGAIRSIADLERYLLNPKQSQFEAHVTEWINLSSKYVGMYSSLSPAKKCGKENVFVFVFF